jgi:predicted transcriptional regulator
MARRMKKKLSKSAAIRTYTSSHPDAKPKEIAENLNQSGYKITPQYVSTILSNDRKKGPSVRRRRAIVVGSASIDQLLAVKKLVNEVGGVQAAQHAIAQYSRLMA